MTLELRSGDIVCTTYSIESDKDGPNWLQWLLAFGIRQVESFNDVDGQARYTHTFAITSKRGTTFEALWRYEHQNIYEAYVGQPVLIGRHREMTEAKAQLMHQTMVREFKGRRYPAWKLPLFLVTHRFMKYLPGKPVCSELVFWGLSQVGLINHWRGVTPSYVEDAIRRWRSFEIVYEGIMPE